MNLHDYLKSPVKDYRTGLKLYNQHKTNTAKDVFFNSVLTAEPGSLHHNLLLQQLQQIWRKLPDAQKWPKTESPAPLKNARTITAETAPGAKAPAKFVYDDVIDVAKLSDEFKAKYFRNQEITKKMARLHIELQDAGNDDERMAIANALDALNKERNINWDAIKSAAGILPENGQTTLPTKPQANETTETNEPKLTAADVLNIKKQMDTVRININRAKKEIAGGKLTQDKIDSRNEKIITWEQKLKELQVTLENI